MDPNVPIEQQPGYNDNRGPQFRAYILILFVAAALATGLRFWSRSLNVPPRTSSHHSRYWWDDWTALASLLGLAGQVVIIMTLVDQGLGRHFWALKPQQQTNILKLLFAEYFVYDITLTLTRASALFFFSRIFNNFNGWDWLNTTIWITHGMNIAWFVGIVLGTLFICNPIQRNWMPFLTEGSCGPTNGLYVGSAVPSVAIDLIILALPLPKIWTLHASLARKVGISIVFALGYGVIVAALGRLVTVFTEAEALNTDISYGGMNVFYWTCAEAPISILGINLPAMLRLSNYLGNSYLQPLARRFSSIISRTTGSSTLRSRSGNYSRSRDERDIPLDDSKISRQQGTPSDPDLGHRTSGESQKQMIGLTRKQTYSARVQSDRSEAFGSGTMPQSSIRVENNVWIDRQSS